MGTTNTTTGSNTSGLQFNPISQGVYNNLTQGAGQQLGGYINNPFGNAMYGLGLGQSQRGAQQQGQNNINAIGQNQLTQGLGGNAGQGWAAAQRTQTGRANASMMSQANISNVMAALQRQMGAIGTGLSYSPQLTGQSGNFNQSSSVGGLGTWLPQLLGAGLGAASGGLFSGLGGAASSLPFTAGGAPSAVQGVTGALGPMSGMGSGGLAGIMSGMTPSMPSFNPYMSMMGGGLGGGGGN